MFILPAHTHTHMQAVPTADEVRAFFNRPIPEGGYPASGACALPPVLSPPETLSHMAGRTGAMMLGEHIVDHFYYGMPAKVHIGGNGCVVYESFAGLPIGARTAVVGFNTALLSNQETPPEVKLAVCVPKKYAPTDGSAPTVVTLCEHTSRSRSNGKFPLFDKGEFVAYANLLMRFADCVETPAEGWGHMPSVGPHGLLGYFGSLLSVGGDEMGDVGGGGDRRRKGGR